MKRMPEFANKMAFVVPTRDRPTELRRLLTSVRGQWCWPVQIIVVNGGDSGLEAIVKKEFSDLPIQYVEVHPPSLTKQKNTGVRMVHPSINLVACIDDDIVFQDGTIEAMLRFWDSAGEEVAGASFNIVGERPVTSWMHRFFFIDNSKFGRILASGYNTPIVNARETRPVEWLIGGATVWRRDIFREYAFNEWFLGSGLAEDLDFSYRVGKGYELYVVADAKVQHLEPRGSWRSNFLIGRVQVINRIYFVRKNPELSLVRCLWSLIGLLLSNLAKGIVTLDPLRVMRACGNVVALVQVGSGQRRRVDASFPTSQRSS